MLLLKKIWLYPAKKIKNPKILSSSYWLLQGTPPGVFLLGKFRFFECFFNELKDKIKLIEKDLKKGFGNLNQKKILPK
jgi:hypothetical protein